MTADGIDEDTVLSPRREATLLGAVRERAVSAPGVGEATSRPVLATSTPVDDGDTVARSTVDAERSRSAQSVADSDDTVMTPPTLAAVPEPAAGDQAAALLVTPSAPDSDDTIARPSRLDRARRAVDGPIAGAAPTSREDASERAEESVPRVVGPRVRLPDGSTVALDRPLLIGRRPALPRVPQTPEPRLITLPSPTRELSSTHLELAATESAIVATDLHSANGTVVLLPSGVSRRLVAGDSTVVQPGSLIMLGEGNVLTVLGAGSDTASGDPGPPATHATGNEVQA